MNNVNKRKIIGSISTEDFQRYEAVKAEFSGMIQSEPGLAELDARVAALLGWKEIKSVYENFWCVGIDPEKKYLCPIPMYCEDHNKTTKILNIMRREYKIAIYADISGFRVTVSQHEVISFGRTLVDVGHAGGIGMAICTAFTKLVEAILAEQRLLDSITEEPTDGQR